MSETLFVSVALAVAGALLVGVLALVPAAIAALVRRHGSRDEGAVPDHPARPARRGLSPALPSVSAPVEISALP